MDKILELKEKIFDYREQVQSKSRSKSKFGKKVEKISSRLYIFLFILTIVGYFFFFFSRDIFVDDSPFIMNTRQILKRQGGNLKENSNRKMSTLRNEHL